MFRHSITRPKVTTHIWLVSRLLPLTFNLFSSTSIRMRNPQTWTLCWELFVSTWHRSSISTPIIYSESKPLWFWKTTIDSYDKATLDSNHQWRDAVHGRRKQWAINSGKTVRRNYRFYWDAVKEEICGQCEAVALRDRQKNELHAVFMTACSEAWIQWEGHLIANSVIDGDQSSVFGVADFNFVIIFRQEPIDFEVFWNWHYFKYCAVGKFLYGRKMVHRTSHSNWLLHL